MSFESPAHELPIQYRKKKPLSSDVKSEVELERITPPLLLRVIELDNQGTELVIWSAIDDRA